VRNSDPAQARERKGLAEELMRETLREALICPQKWD
jgi:hypothetical protein